MFSDTVAGLIRNNEPLAPHCWLRIGGSAKYFAEVATTPQLATLCADAKAAQLPIRILGNGSNVLIRSGVVEALVVRLAGTFEGVRVDGNRLIAGSAAGLNSVISSAAAAGLAGLEHLAGIPGTIGGAVVSNSGVTNDDLGSRVTRVAAIDRSGVEVSFDRESLKFGFRRSNLDDVIVTEVELNLDPLNPTEVTRRLQANWIVKKAAQPPTGARVAQAFIEPSEAAISQLLDAAGMRTASEGSATMSSQYPGFLMVNENANAEEVLALVNRIKRAVEVQSGIQLQPQLKIW